jgi:hypothetical protein
MAQKLPPHIQFLSPAVPDEIIQMIREMGSPQSQGYGKRYDDCFISIATYLYGTRMTEIRSSMTTIKDTHNEANSGPLQINTKMNDLKAEYNLMVETINRVIDNNLQ